MASPRDIPPLHRPGPGAPAHVARDEHPDAADEPVEFARRLGRAIRAQLDELVAQDPQRRLVMRFERYRRLGY